MQQRTGVQRSRALEVTAEELDETVGSGTRGAQRGDLVMLHYVATLSDGTVFDSTRGGLVGYWPTYRKALTNF